MVRIGGSFRWVLIGVLAAFLSLPRAASAQQIGNILSLPTTSFEPGLGETIDPAELAFITDGDVVTTGKFRVQNGDAINLLYHLGDDVFSPNAATIVLGPQDQPAKIDILGSNVSGSSGFFSLRSSTLTPDNPNLKLDFRASAVKWILVRIFPEAGSSSLALSEISITGQKGQPETAYAFSESPANALDIVALLSNLGTVASDISADELQVFEQAKAGELPWNSFAQASLLASNVTNPSARTAYVQRLETLVQQAQSVVGDTHSNSDKGQKLLTWLHKTVLTNGYISGQTDLSTVLDTGTYNCVSSAVIYNILAKRLGIDARAIEVPDHAFSIVYDGVDHMDVETTTEAGFNPSRDRIAEFEKLTGFSYIPQSNVAQRREIGDAGLAALIYYNHGVTAVDEGRYYDALVSNLKAMSLDPEFASAAKNALSALANWSLTLSENGRWEDALSVIQIGSKLAPEDALLANNHKAIWSSWADALAKDGNQTEALAVLKRGQTELPEAGLEAQQAWIFIENGEQQVEAEQWELALDVTDNGLGLLSGQPLLDLEEWRASIYLRWMNSRMDQADFASVPTIVEKGLARYPDDPRLLNSVAYLGQEWSHILPDFGVAMAMLSELSTRFPEAKESLIDVATSYAWRRVEALVGAGQSSTAIALVDVLPQTILTDEKHGEVGAFAYDIIAKDQMAKGLWEEAGQTYADGLARYPTDSLLAGNSKYFAQQWQAHARKAEGLDGISKVTTALIALFPDMEDISQSGEQEIRRVVYEQVEKMDFEGALDYLASAGPFLSQDSQLNLLEFIFDNWAKDRIGAGDWEAAADIYARALQRAPQSRLFVGNTDYLIQEWAAAQTALGGAVGLISTAQKATQKFAGIHPTDEVISNVAAMHAQRTTEAGNYEDALTFTNDIASLLGPEAGDQIRENIFDVWAKTLMSEGQWREAGAKFIEGRETLPDSSLLKQNMAYFVQEWARAEFEATGADGLIEVAKIVTAQFARFPDAQDVVSNVASIAAADRIRTGDFEEGLRLAEQTKQIMSDDAFTEIVVFSFDSWARTYFEKDWAKAAEIYENGLVKLPENAILMQNRDYSLSKLN